MNSEEEQDSYLIGDALRKMMAHGLPRQIADLSIRASIRDIVSSGNLLPGGLLVFVPGDKGQTPALNYEIQAVFLKIFYAGQVTCDWVSIRIPRSVIDAATPPWRPSADNDNLRRLANGTTGQPVHSATASQGRRGRKKGSTPYPTDAQILDKMDAYQRSHPDVGVWTIAGIFAAEAEGNAQESAQRRLNDKFKLRLIERNSSLK